MKKKGVDQKAHSTGGVGCLDSSCDRGIGIVEYGFVVPGRRKTRCIAYGCGDCSTVIHKLDR